MNDFLAKINWYYSVFSHFGIFRTRRFKIASGPPYHRLAARSGNPPKIKIWRKFSRFFIFTLSDSIFIRTESILDSSTVFRAFSASSVDCAYSWWISISRFVLKHPARRGLHKDGEPSDFDF